MPVFINKLNDKTGKLWKKLYFCCKVVDFLVHNFGDCKLLLLVRLLLLVLVSKILNYYLIISRDSLIIEIL